MNAAVFAELAGDVNFCPRASNNIVPLREFLDIRYELKINSESTLFVIRWPGTAEFIKRAGLLHHTGYNVGAQLASASHFFPNVDARAAVEVNMCWVLFETYGRPAMNFPPLVDIQKGGNVHAVSMGKC